MEKNNAKPIIGASAAAPIQATVPASDVAAGASAAAPVQAPVGWDPYEQVPCVTPENPYDTSIVIDEPEAQSSDVDSDDESFHTKARHVLQRLQFGQYDRYLAGGVFRCPFCNRHLRSTEFNSLVNHVESLGHSSPRVGMTVNVYSFIAHHKALGIHLRSLQAIHRRNLKALNDVPIALSVCRCSICRAA